MVAFKAFITKHSLTEGIQKAEGEEREGCFYYSAPFPTHKPRHHTHARPGEWYRTREEAVAKAEEMRKKRIASLKRSIKKVEDLKF